jgi:hypothetical protein
METDDQTRLKALVAKCFPLWLVVSNPRDDQADAPIRSATVLLENGHRAIAAYATEQAALATRDRAQAAATIVSFESASEFADWLQTTGQPVPFVAFDPGPIGSDSQVLSVAAIVAAFGQAR